MFDESKFRKLRLMVYEHREPNDFYFPYMYVDELNDVVDIHKKLWEMGEIPSATNQFLKISGDRNMVYPNGRIIQLMQRIINFNGRTFRDNQSVIKTYLGFYDLSLHPVTMINQCRSLLPHIKSHDKIWVNDLAMIASPTYFIDLFDAKLWYAFLTIFALIGLISSLTILLLKKFTKIETDHLNWFSILVNQGANENSRFISRRFLLISLSIATIFFHGAFEAFMSSMLAIRNPDLPFTEISSLLKLPSYTICALPRSPAFDQITFDAAKLKRPALINSDTCPDIFRNFDGSRNSIDRSAMLCPLTRMVYIGPGMCFFPKMSEQCSLISLPGKYFEKYITMAMYPGFKYVDQFNQANLRLRSSGHLDYLVKQYDLQQLHQICSKKFIMPDPDISVNFFQIRWLLVILMLGFVFSTICAIFELLYIKKKFNMRIFNR